MPCRAASSGGRAGPRQTLRPCCRDRLVRRVGGAPAPATTGGLLRPCAGGNGVGERSGGHGLWPRVRCRVCPRSTLGESSGRSIGRDVVASGRCRQLGHSARRWSCQLPRCPLRAESAVGRYGGFVDDFPQTLRSGPSSCPVWWFPLSTGRPTMAASSGHRVRTGWRRSPMRASPSSWPSGSRMSEDRSPRS